MLRYCHDISNIKQYDDNTVILYLYFPAAVAFRNKSEASMQCACENTHTHWASKLAKFFFPAAGAHCRGGLVHIHSVHSP